MADDAFGSIARLGWAGPVVEWVGRLLLAGVTIMVGFGLTELRSMDERLSSINSRIAVVETKALGNEQVIQQMNQARQMLWDSINERLNRLEENVLRNRDLRFNSDAIRGASPAAKPAGSAPGEARSG